MKTKSKFLEFVRRMAAGSVALFIVGIAIKVVIAALFALNIDCTTIALPSLVVYVLGSAGLVVSMVLNITADYMAE